MTQSNEVGKLTVTELKTIIRETFDEVTEDFFEDIEAMLSDNYKKSINDAREDIKKGELVTFDDLKGQLNSSQ